MLKVIIGFDFNIPVCSTTFGDLSFLHLKSLCVHHSYLIQICLLFHIKLFLPSAAALKISLPVAESKIHLVIILFIEYKAVFSPREESYF